MPRRLRYPEVIKRLSKGPLRKERPSLRAEISYYSYSNTILILNDYKDAERRSAEGDRKALCSPPQRRNPFAAYERDDLETD